MTIINTSSTTTNSAEESATESDSNPYLAPESQTRFNPIDVQYSGKIYNAFSIAAATLFGSVLVAGLLIAANFDKFGEKGKSFAAAITTIIVTILMLFFSLFLPTISALLYIAINFVAAIFMLPLVYFTQGSIIEKHDEMGRDFHSIFRAMGIGIICMFGLGLILTTAIRLLIGYNTIY